MADEAASRRNRFKVDRVNSAGSEGDGDDSEVSLVHCILQHFFR